MSVEFRETANGILLPVQVAAGSRTAGIRGTRNGALKISVTVAPEKGKANKAVIKLLTQELGIAASRIEIVSGATARTKQVLITGITAGQLGDRLKEILS